MPELATKNVVVSEATHARLDAAKAHWGWASFDITISRALDLLERHSADPNEPAWSYPRQTPEPPQNAHTAPSTS